MMFIFHPPQPVSAEQQETILTDLDMTRAEVEAARAALPRTWRAFCRLPRTQAARWQVLDAHLLLDGTPIVYRLWCVAGALAAHAWDDAGSEAEMILEQVEGLYHLYLRVRRPLYLVFHRARLTWWFLADPLWRAMELHYWRLRLYGAWCEFQRLGQPRVDLWWEERREAPPGAAVALLLAVAWPLLWLLLGGLR